MAIGFKQFVPNLTNYYTFATGFSDIELEAIEKLADKIQSENASVLGSPNNVNDYRRSTIKWLPNDGEYSWIYEKLFNYAEEANNVMWKFNIGDNLEKIQYTIYDSSDAGMYDWHIDCGDSSPSCFRKISITVQLTGPNDYSGGDLILKYGKNDTFVPKDKGRVVIFPSFALHRVTPVESGIRKSLVLWLGGSSYK
jgi:PKHD-type hydroxylase